MRPSRTIRPLLSSVAKPPLAVETSPVTLHVTRILLPPRAIVSNISRSIAGFTMTLSDPFSSVYLDGVRLIIVRRQSPCHLLGSSRGPSICWVPSSPLPGYHVETIFVSIDHSAPCMGKAGPRRVSFRPCSPPELLTSTIVRFDEYAIDSPTCDGTPVSRQQYHAGLRLS